MTRDEILQTLALNYLRPEMAQEFLQKAWQERDALAAEIAQMRAKLAAVENLCRSDGNTYPRNPMGEQARIHFNAGREDAKAMIAALLALPPQKDLPAEAMRILNENRFALYEDGAAPSPDPVSPQDTSLGQVRERDVFERRAAAPPVEE